MVRRGQAGHGRFGKARIKTRRGMVWFGRARQGKDGNAVRQGKVRFGKAR